MPQYRPISLGSGLVLVRGSETLSTVAVGLTRLPLWPLSLPGEVATNIHRPKLTPSKGFTAPLA